MAEFIFDQRYVLPKLVNPEEAVLRDILLNPDNKFGEALLSYQDEEKTASLIVLHEPHLGYYLKFMDETGEWLSLWDDTRLEEVIIPDDWEASVGLFIPIQDAWAAIQDFYRFGICSTKIRWIRPWDMPENGNY